MKMNERIKKLWLGHLREGKLKQARGKLKKGTKYCCLGVLTKLYIEEKGTDDITTYEGEDLTQAERKDYLWNDFEGCLTPEVAKWAGLNGSNRTDPHIKRVSLSQHNDGDEGNTWSGKDPIQRKTFKEIADLIEKNL